MQSSILILFYSSSGNTRTLASQVARGVDSVTDCTAVLRTVPAVTACTEGSVPPPPNSGAPFATQDDLAACDGLILGSPARFGNMAAPLKHFLEQTTSNWFAGDLADKPAAVFTSGGSLHGGQEITLMTMLVPLLHHGMLITGLPYTEAALRHTKTGGTPYGASHVSGERGSQPTSEHERELARALGRRVATLARKLAT